MPLAISVVPPLLAPLLTLLGAAPPAATPVDRWTPGAPATAVERAVAPGVWPLAPPLVVAGFDPPSTRWSAGHRGVDLQGLPGQQVRAAVAGTVSFAGTLAGRGVVVVTHGQTRTTYEPVLAWVDVGVAVAAGDPLGVLEPGGHCPPAACLHWGLRRGDTYLDPLSLIAATPIRLLPLDGLKPAGAPDGRPNATDRW